MAAYDNTNSGALFTNEKKTEDRHPDFQGSIDVDGVQYWLSGWKKIIQKGDKAGQKMISLSIKPKDEQNAGQAKSGNGKQQHGRDDDGFF